MNFWIPLITGLLGTLIGASASIITIYIQMKMQEKKEIIRLTCDLALEDYKLTSNLLKDTGKDFTLQPIASYVHFHSKLLAALSKGTLDESCIKTIFDKNQKVCHLIEKLDAERRNNYKQKVDSDKKDEQKQ